MSGISVKADIQHSLAIHSHFLGQHADVREDKDIFFTIRDLQHVVTIEIGSCTDGRFSLDDDSGSNQRLTCVVGHCSFNRVGVRGQSPAAQKQRQERNASK